MEYTAETLSREIESDPRLALLAHAITEIADQQKMQGQAIVDLVQILTEHRMQILDSLKEIKEVTVSLKKVAESVDIIINQMFVISQHPVMPRAFKGIFIK